MTDKRREYIQEEAKKALAYIPDDAKKLIDAYIDDMAEERAQARLKSELRAQATQSWTGPLSVVLVLATLAGCFGLFLKSCKHTEEEIDVAAKAQCDSTFQELQRLKKQKLEFCRSQR